MKHIAPALALALLVACEAAPSDEPPSTTGEQTASRSVADASAKIELVSIRGEQGFPVACLRVVNPGSAPLSFSGFAHDQPIFHRQQRTASGWEKEQVGWCGTGLRTVVLAPGKAIEFEVPFIEGQDEMKVGLTLTDAQEGPIEVWSDAIDSRR